MSNRINADTPRRIGSVSESMRWPAGKSNKGRCLRQDDHHFSGFHKRSRRISDLQTHFAHGVGCNDRRDVLPADGKSHLRYQAVDLNVGDAPNQLVAPADATEIGTALTHGTSFGR